MERSWVDEWITHWKDEGLTEDEYPLEELPVVHDSDTWVVWRCWRRTACENRIGDSKIWVKAPHKTAVHIEYEYGEGQAFDHPNISGTVDAQGYLWWYNAARTPGRMSVEMDGELLVERIRFDLGNEYCKPPGSPFWSGNRPTNRPGQYVYDIVIVRVN